MPVDLSIPNSIIAAFATGAAEKQKEQQLAQTKQLTEEQHQIERERLVQEEKLASAQLDVHKALNRAVILQHAANIGKISAETGITPPGATQVPYSGTVTDETGTAQPVMVRTDEAGNTFQKFSHPDIGEFEVPTIGVSEAARQAPRIEAQKTLAEYKAGFEADLEKNRQEARRQLENLQAKHKAELSQIQKEADYRRAWDIQLLKNQGKEKPEDKWLTDTQAETFGVPFGTTRKQVAGRTPGVKLNAQQTGKLADYDTLERTVLDASDQLEKIDYRVFKGPLKGGLKELGRSVGITKRDPEEETARASLANFQAAISKVRHGTALSPREKEILDNYTSGFTASEDPISARAKLQGILKYIRGAQGDVIGEAANRIVTPGTKGKKTLAPTLTPGKGRLSLDDLIKKHSVTE